MTDTLRPSSKGCRLEGGGGGGGLTLRKGFQRFGEGPRLWKLQSGGPVEAWGALVQLDGLG